ncbi:hypothetical protein M0805_000498 [Coniferiporia weirii]|nr:hypothetical protein M0805_000498 [Coniferiporia weirii]
MIETEIKYFAPSDDSTPALVVQSTRLVNSYMLWVGSTEAGPSEAQRAPLGGSLCRDWACAMPPTSSAVPASASSLFRTPSSDVALSMAQRLARRFKKQIFLSIDLPSSSIAMGHGPKLVQEAERRVVERLRELEARGDESTPGTT